MGYQTTRRLGRRVLGALLLTTALLCLTVSGVSAHGTADLSMKDIGPPAAVGLALFLFLFSFILLAPADMLGLPQRAEDDVLWYDEEKRPWRQHGVR